MTHLSPREVKCAVHESTSLQISTTLRNSRAARTHPTTLAAGGYPAHWAGHGAAIIVQTKLSATIAGFDWAPAWARQVRSPVQACPQF